MRLWQFLLHLQNLHLNEGMHLFISELLTVYKYI